MDPRETRLRAQVDALDLATATGVWAIRSESSTVYFVDLDRGCLMRARGKDSQVFPYDDQWLPLIEVSSHDSSQRPGRLGVVRVGERPRWLTDPRGGAGAYEWRLQRTITAIEPVTEEQVVALRVPGPDGEDLDGPR
ncbi:hypothetical protein DDP54_07800 [Cellulomonas sp. WB94]|uniref:hypothetical protein n=1 Tax=Cellulomonas sp. WB94 TaxID=2173174 RepID=UPI000D58158A|nr:hypothetical protein [Cellulomonas sp. WB94]PVU82923.1 hypothetical protein DDP54_07800 [Cellulomonas sp. WB94]